MKLLDRYILRAFLVNYVIALLVLIGLYVLLDLVVNLDEFTKLTGDQPPPTIAQTLTRIISFYGYNLFLYFAQLSGVVTLAAACFTLGRFHRTNEFTAVLASGVSLYRVATPVILAALGVNALWFVDQELILPRIAAKLARKHDDIEGRKTFSVWFRPDRNKALVSAAMFSHRHKEIRGLVVLGRDAQFGMTSILLADQAHWDPERQTWSLERGFQIRFTGESTDAAQSHGVTAETYESELNPDELALYQASQWTMFVDLPKLSTLQKRFPRSSEYIKAKHIRLTTVPINMIMLLLGVPFFLNRERPSVLLAGGRCLLLCGACFVTTFVCQSVDLRGVDIPAALPAWIPVLAFGWVAVLMLDGIKT